MYSVSVEMCVAVVPVVVPMVVWIAWWACVDVLFHVLFHTRPPTVMSDVCQCVFHTQITTKHSAVQLVHHPSTLHLVNHQQHTFLHATHTNPSRFFHNCPSFFSMSSSSSSFLRPLSVSCDGMHQLFAPIINTLCVPLWCHPARSSLYFGA